jgi:hypothetical protein
MRFRTVILFFTITVFSCTDDTTNDPGSGGTADEALFNTVTQTDPFTSYALFPNADSVTSGTLNGSNAHVPMVRVSMNATAFGVLQGDTLPAGSSFPNGSVVFKQIISGGQTALYAVMRKDSASAFAGNGWLWAEYGTDGSVVYSVENRGSACISCHLREDGPQNDHVRTFERQN